MDHTAILEAAVSAAAGIAVGYWCAPKPHASSPCAPPGGAATTHLSAIHTTEPYEYSCAPFESDSNVESDDVKVVHFIRHAQGTHNLAVSQEGELAYSSWNYRDARLTPQGVAQSAEAVRITDAMTFDTVLISPLSRTLQTAIAAIPSQHGNMAAEELVRERIGLNPCDYRRERHELQSEFPQINFDLLPSESDTLWSRDRESLEALQNRCDAFLTKLFDGQLTAACKYVGVVTHNDFLTMLLYDSSLRMAPSMPADKKFANCEIRSYVIKRRRLRPRLDDSSLTEEQRARYPKSTGHRPVVH